MGFPGSFPQGINPWVVGQLFPGWAAQLLYDDSTPTKLHPVDLTGLTGSAITLIIQPVDSNGVDVGGSANGAGTVAITDAPNGKITYPPNVADQYATTAGYVKMRWKVVMAGTLPWFSDWFVLRTDAVS